MSDIDYKHPGSILTPLKALEFFAREPVTQPLAPRPAAPNYRGFHVNDWQLCIGCSTCQKVCDNAAITMVRIPDLPVDAKAGVRNLRPAIDYGRCCWCGLCVDLCPTASIALTREYVHTCDGDAVDSYFILPDPNGMHGDYFERGWDKSPDNDLIDPHRQPMTELPANERVDSFDEMVAGLDPNQAIIEASRCVQCGMCHDACPTHMHAGQYIRAIWRGELEEAVRQIYRTNPFAHTCGRVCTHCCETACAIGRRGEPIAIRWLKRYAIDAVDHEQVRRIAAEGRIETPSGRHIAIVGAGPAGLTAAFDLARSGHAVTVFEALAQAGGMPRYGIPYYRLPADSLNRDIDVILSMGVDIRYNTAIGRDVSMAELQRDHDAVVLAIGLQLGRSTRIPGADHAGVATAVDLLRHIAAGDAVEVPDTALVIGGGNVAMDIARSLARLQQQRYGHVQVTVTALEDRAHLLADADEIREAEEEGIVICDARGPREVVIEDGRVVGLKTWRVVSVFDADGRFAPRYDDGDEQLHAAGLVVEAIGQASDVAILGAELTEKLDWRRGRLCIDSDCRTSEPWLWAAGDMVNGPDVVSAVADGHRVAASIECFLQQGASR